MSKKRPPYKPGAGPGAKRPVPSAAGGIPPGVTAPAARATGEGLASPSLTSLVERTNNLPLAVEGEHPQAVVPVEAITALIRAMAEHDFAEVRCETPALRIELRRHAAVNSVGVGSSAPASAAPVPVITVPAPVPSVAPVPVPSAVAAPAPASPPAEKLLNITSPMVGTFYAAANPEAPPFVKVGTPVEPDTVVCIIDAMKVMNEIPANVAGTIDKVLVRNGEAVEFGKPLFVVRPR